jgi:hypothetical protein
MVKLYRFVDGRWRLVDFGVPSKIPVYLALGYVVRLICITLPPRRHP